MITFQKVSKTFGETMALKDVSFKVEKGEFVFITGPSGSGKTTILKLLLKEIIPDSGSITVEGKDISKILPQDLPSYRQKIGVVFQDYKVLEERTVRENIEVALAVIGVEEKDWKERTDHVLKITGLLPRAEFFPSQLSGGEIQRLSLARALVVNPKMILADEPTGNLDWDISKEIMELFEKINKEGKIIIMATHNKMLIEKFKKREIHLTDGKIKEEK
jgi:cell division transport system ATP-binding protein